jgi:SAM-dependent methyltransferase
MLIFKTALHEHFARQHAATLAQLLSGHSMLQGEPKPGEQSIQRTFTEEWAVVEDNNLTFTYTTEELTKLQSEVWFNSSAAPTAVRRVLDIGCGGYAAEAEALRLNLPNAEVFAVDLNLHLLRNGHKFSPKHSLHVVIASLFHLPFEKQSFDLVFSQGVLHHTYSTREALFSIASYNSKNGFLFIWLYAIEDHQVAKGFKGLRERLRYYLLMVGLRPVLSVAPKFIRVGIVNLIALYGYLRHRYSRGPKRAGWKFKNAVHATYDYITPRYAHVHAFNEVIEWYESLGYSYGLHSPAKYRRLFGRPIHGIGVLGRHMG